MPRKPLLIGITGGIGSGKSIVCKIFESFGIPTYYADDRAKWLMNNDPELKSKVIDQFGEQAYVNGELDRAYIGKLAFHDQEVLNKLNSIVHPLVGKDFKDWVSSNSDKPYLLKEAALIFEAGSYTQLDKVISVYADQEIRIARVLQRDPHRNKEDILAIIQKQMPEEEKMERADFVIHNDGSSSLIKQVQELNIQFRS